MAVVSPVDLLKQLETQTPASPRKQGAEEVPSFSETLKKFVSDVNNLQLEADNQMRLMAAGQAENLHDVMIAVEKAGISFELLMEIRNKVLEAYQELMRMQV